MYGTWMGNKKSMLMIRFTSNDGEILSEMVMVVCFSDKEDNVMDECGL